MMIDDMLREPGIPIGSWVDRAMMNTPDVSGREASDRAMLYGMHSDKSVDVTRDDNESVLEQKYDLGVFDKRNHHIDQERIQGIFADSGTREELTTFRRASKSPEHIRSSRNHDQLAYRASSSVQEKQDIEKELTKNNLKSDRDSTYDFESNTSEANTQYNIVSKV